MGYYDILHKLSGGQYQCGGIAQLARATGSYPVGHGFKSNSRYQRPVGQAVKTPPFHGGNGGSIPPRVTKTKNTLRCVLLFCIHNYASSPTGHQNKSTPIAFCLIGKFLPTDRKTEIAD